MALNVSSTAAVNARCSSAGSTCASVVTNPSIVAIIGSIMPEPLAMPPTRNVPFDGAGFRRRFLGEGIGGHDRAGGVGAAAAGQRRRGLSDAAWPPSA